jgi:hypothetical protein
MRWFVAACVLALGLGATSAHEFKMKAGEDTFVFDFDFNGRNINVYEILPDDPQTDEMESLMHNWFAVEDIMQAVPEAFQKPGIKLQMGATGDIGANAFASIYNGKRYVVIGGPIHSNYAMMTLVMGHELGHHVCGHTAGVLQRDPWAKELEADTFAGLTIRGLEAKGGGWGITLQSALQYASQLLPAAGSATHPPLEQRIQAIIDGYNNGSPCVGRPMVPIANNEIGGSLQAAEPLWNHNGSTMRLIADGATREFLYESPRTGMKEAGVRKGTLLFKGIRAGNSYSGTAFVFTPCGALSYAVNGPVSDDQREVTLTGRMPIPNANCSITRYRDDTLVFTFAGD